MSETLWDHCLRLMRAASPRYSMSEAQQAELWKYACLVGEPDTIVELGVCHGKTALMLAWLAHQNGLKYLGVDNWSLEGSRAEVEQLFLNSGIPVGSDIQLVEGSTHTVEMPENIGLLLIDAGHDEANVSVDCARWLPQLKRTGYAVFDDYPGINDPAHCHHAVKVHADKWTANWEMLSYFDGRMLIRKKPI